MAKNDKTATEIDPGVAGDTATNESVAAEASAAQISEAAPAVDPYQGQGGSYIVDEYTQTRRRNPDA